MLKKMLKKMLKNRVKDIIYPVIYSLCKFVKKNVSFIPVFKKKLIIHKEKPLNLMRLVIFS